MSRLASRRTNSIPNRRRGRWCSCPSVTCSMPLDVPSVALRAGSVRRSLARWRRSGSGRFTGRWIEGAVRCLGGSRIAHAITWVRPYAGPPISWSGSGRTAPSGPGSHHGEAALGGKFYGEGVGVAARVVDLFDASVHDHLHAHQAWLVGAVNGGACHGDAVVGGLDDGVLLGVERALAALAAVHDPDEASDVVAVGHPGRTAVIAGSQDTFVADDHGAHGEPGARRAGRDLVRYAHEVLVPGGTSLLQRLVGIGGVYGGVFKGFHRVCLQRRPVQER